MSIIEEIIPFVVDRFTYICNLSFNIGVFPNAMKIAKVLSVYKNGAKNELSNYRPILLLPQFSKILEQLFDFNAGRSPSMALLSLIENITTSVDAHKHAVGVSTDIKNAFNTIHHSILLKK